MSSTHSLPNARSGRQTLIRAYPSLRRIALLLEGIGGLAFLSWGVVILYGATHSATMNNKDRLVSQQLGSMAAEVGLPLLIAAFWTWRARRTPAWITQSPALLLLVLLVYWR